MGCVSNGLSGAESVTIHRDNMLDGSEIWRVSTLFNDARETQTTFTSSHDAADYAVKVIAQGAEWEPCPCCFSRHPEVVVKEDIATMQKVAPELYDALRKIHDCFNGLDREYWDESMEYAFNAASRALAKVDG